MKTLLASTFLAAFVAFVLLPLRLETAGLMLFSAGFAAIVIGDYARTHRPLRVPRTSSVAVTATGRTERFRLAA